MLQAERLLEENKVMKAALENIIHMAKRGSESTDMTRASFREGLADIEAQARSALTFG